MDQSPASATTCYLLAMASAAGAVISGVAAYNALGDVATWWTFLLGASPAVVSAVVLWTLGGIAEDVRATRMRVAPPPPPAPLPQRPLPLDSPDA